MMHDLHHHKGAVISLKFTTDTLVTGSSVSGYKPPYLNFEVLIFLL